MIKHLLLLLLFPIFSNCQSIRNQPVPISNETSRQWQAGWISVAENSAKSNTKAIELPFIFAKTTKPSKIAKVPVLIMSGGPGNSSLHMANGIVKTPWAQSRDLLIFEQRGTRYSQPALNCPEIDSFQMIGINDGQWGKAIDSLRMIGTKHCFDRLAAKNIDLSAYHTLASVKDIESLRKALKIDQLILYGMSYSCNLMTAYAQTYPDKVVALVLDSPLPHASNYDEEAFQNIDRTLAKIVDHFTGDRLLYDQWKEYISTLKDTVFETKVDSQTFYYTKNELIDLLLIKMSDHSSIAEIPSAMQQILKGNHEGITEVIKYSLSPTRQAIGMRYSLWIAEELPEEKQTIMDAQAQQYPWLAGYPANDVSFETAKVWPVPSLYQTHQWPRATYDGPALILSGQFDPWTPESYGVKLLPHLPNAKQKVYPEKTHLPGFTTKGMEDIDLFLQSL